MFLYRWPYRSAAGMVVLLVWLAAMIWKFPRGIVMWFGLYAGSLLIVLAIVLLNGLYDRWVEAHRQARTGRDRQPRR